MILKILAGRVDEAAVVRTRLLHYMVRFANDEVTAFKHWAAESTFIYVAKSRKTAAVAVTGPPSLEKVEEAVKRLATAPEDPLYVPIGGPSPATRHESPEDFEKLPDLVKAAVDAASGVERSAGVVHLTHASVSYEDTAGRSGAYSVNRVYMAMRSFLGDLSATSAAAGRRIGDIDAARLGRENAHLLDLARGLPQVRVEPARADLLLSPLVFAHLIGEAAGNWASGSEVLAGTSRYTKEDIGREVASQLLTVADAAHDPGAYGHTPFDLEGVPPRPVEIYRGGQLAGLLHTRRTAHALGMEPTGHAMHHYARPWPGHIRIAPGDGPADLEELLRDLRRGYYIHNNWYTRFQNVKTGQFSTVGRDVALEVRDGKPVAVVKYIRIADTLENLVNNVAQLSREARQIYWWDMPTPAHSPHAIVKNIGITT
ncbi:MAG: TldD/PmbA family protein [Pyrobaculum sp.]